MITDHQIHRRLIELSFEKAREELKKTGTSYHSKKQKAEVLSDVIFEYGYTYSPKSIINLYRNLIELHRDELIKKPEVILALCKYLGYPDYEAFKVPLTDMYTEPSPTEREELKTVSRRSWNKRRIVISGIFVMSILAGLLSFKVLMPHQRWMEWQGTHYEEVSYDPQKLQHGTLKLYKEERIRIFKKITPDCNTEFFTEHGKENIWYGKNEAGQLDFFTGHGLHPETGKTLKAITPYMIRKYICKDY
ncbi:hypothetical protein [Sinomicrobium oceani]|uniref:hypothetical protein n=1 Tax=Sinomicrobium oceani TaxID=1150368 RepID=UPI00227C7001|nr:hypothetical protein [Sinomicrobium oceani]